MGGSDGIGWFVTHLSLILAVSRHKPSGPHVTSVTISNTKTIASQKEKAQDTCKREMVLEHKPSEISVALFNAEKEQYSQVSSFQDLQAVPPRLRMVVFVSGVQHPAQVNCLKAATYIHKRKMKSQSVFGLLVLHCTPSNLCSCLKWNQTTTIWT